MPPTKLATQLKALAKKKTKIQLDPRHTPFWFMSKMKGADIIKAPCPIEKAKACKNSAEQRGARKAHFYDGLACVRFLYWLEKNWRKTSELEAAQKLEALRRQEKALMDLSFETISASGANGAIIHYRVNKKSNRKLKAGELYLCDSGGQYRQGTTDITRTITLGKAGKEEKQNFTHVLQGHIALARAYFPENTSGAQLDALARGALWRAGLDFAHGTGHGVGSFLSVHEGPQIISKHGTYPLQKGMIVSNEPGYYKKGRYGIRIESLLLVKQAKAGFLHFETLSLAPIDKRLILKTQLQPTERTWLNEYHAHIYKTLAPHLDPKVKQWLKKSCSPI
ncbi:MAG: M24 family metallopeptidase [Parvibaculales bacterium]